VSTERVRDDVVLRDDSGIRLIRLIVHGQPIAQGSKKSLGPGRPWVEVNKEKLDPWRENIASVVRGAGVRLLTGPMSVMLTFYFPYRKQDLGSTGAPRASAPAYKTTPPDLDKLVRAALDGITKGGLWMDDGQVAVLVTEKRYAPRPGLRIEIRPLGGADGKVSSEGEEGAPGVQGGQAPLWVEEGTGSEEP
jgi:Holliday junction resolvase RusA-like endonuclease